MIGGTVPSVWVSEQDLVLSATAARTGEGLERKEARGRRAESTVGR